MASDEVILKILYAWRRHCFWQKMQEALAGLVLLGMGFAVIYFLMNFGTARYNRRYGDDFNVSDTNFWLFILIVLAIWTIIYLLWGRNRSQDLPDADGANSYGGFISRQIRLETELMFIGPTALELIFVGIYKAFTAGFRPLNDLTETTGYLLRANRRVPFDEIGVDDFKIFERYIDPLIELNVCILLTGDPQGVCVTTPFREFCLKRLGIIE